LQQQFAGHFDVVTFTSASSAHNFHELMTSAQIEIPAALKKVSIGPITSSAIKEHGWQVAAEAEHANMDELVAAVILACS
jgi:uroporphyrinogen-III synthase